MNARRTRIATTIATTTIAAAGLLAGLATSSTAGERPRIADGVSVQQSSGDTLASGVPRGKWWH